LIVFDTSPLIWGIQGTDNPDLAGMPQRVVAYVHHLQERGQVIALPAPVVSEYLRKIPERQHKKHLGIINQVFRVLPFDGPAMSIAAALEQDRDHLKKLRDEHRVSREEISNDAQILATAIAHKAKAVVTHNLKHFRDLAQQRIEVLEVPSVPQQWDLFRDPEALLGDA
jgi:predicted nucleic acid-binding protein